MTVKIRDFQPDDLDWVGKLRSLAFGAPTWASMPLDGWRGFAAELPSGPCGFLRIYDYAQFFGGRAVPMGGLASVSVSPYARGQGVATAMLDAALRAMREAGQCVSALYPSVPPLYRGRGWENAGVVEWLDVRLDALRGTERIELRPAGREDLDAMLALYRSVAKGIDGMLDRRSNGFHAMSLLSNQIRDVALGADGALSGYVCADRSGSDSLEVNEFVATDLATARGLLASIGTWAGQLTTAVVRVLDPLACRQLLPLPMHYTARMQPWMLRVVDLPTAVAARGWPVAAGLRSCAVDVEIVDEHAPWHAGRHRLVVEDGAVRCEPGGSGAVVLTARALAPWFAGAASTATLRGLGQLDGDAEQAAVLDRLIGGTSGGARLLDTF